ncbi:hypothetical protein GGI15_002326 [Coemansia interrupta]|uniref:Uncharacterized protein n=1 Tax=Coemansia interrupta TaxID=1126814 RepID=A0A9W8HHQ1_9FUNG|nr:hypothetical protein GGI15_002326 [Coemansia interrupta]
MVRFGTNTQKVNEPAWQDVGANVLRMDSLYDASFHDWLKCEDNVTIIASYLQRIANEYPMDRIINALRWLVSSWRLESTAIIVRHITADWALPQSTSKANAPSSFLADTHQNLLQTDTSVLSGEARRGVLVRELTKDWTCQQIAQLVGMLAMTFWSERSHLEAFLKTLVSDWDFCRLSSFFSYVSGQLGLDYRVKVSMLQQAARRNASRLSLKRARNDADKASASKSGSDRSGAAAPAHESKSGNDDDSDDVNKRVRHGDSASYSVVSVSSGASTSSDVTSSHAQSSTTSANEISRTSATATSALETAAASSECSVSSDQRPAIVALPSAAAVDNVDSSSTERAPAAPPVLASAASASRSRVTASSFSARASRSGYMPTPLQTAGQQFSRFGVYNHQTSPAGAATTPSSPAVAEAPVSPPATASSLGRMASQPADSAMEVDSSDIPSSTSSTDLASMPYTQGYQQQTQQQQQPRRRSRNNTSGATAAPSIASSSLAAESSSSLAAIAVSNSRGESFRPAAASSEASASAASTAMIVRRPLTPQISSNVFTTSSSIHHPATVNIRRQHRHNHSFQHRNCPQPLTPTHSSSSRSVIGSSEEGMTVSSGNGSSSGSGLLTRPAMRMHAASISSAMTESSPLLESSNSVSAVGNTSAPAAGINDQSPSQEMQMQEFRARTASENELGQFDGPPSTHLALPLPSENAVNGTSLCGRTSAAPYDVLGIVISGETEHT